MRRSFFIIIIASLLLLTACDDTPWNSPYPAHKEESTQNTIYSSFAERPKTLDPARSFSMDEAIFVYQIYETVVQYHYLKRPYVLEPLTAKTMPVITLLDKNRRPLPKGTSPLKAAYTQYDITIKPGIQYQPHPAFAMDENGRYLYHQLSEKALQKIHALQDFNHTGSRELTAEDYVYEMKRLAHPTVNSPLFGIMSSHIVGLKEYAKTLSDYYDKKRAKIGQDFYLDLRQFPLEGVTLIDRYHYRILVKGSYPQFIYWLTMPFFAPIPWEADKFYAQPHMQEKNLSFDWYPVGTGPYMLTENNPNQRMVLSKNPYYHDDFYPTEGAPGDQEKGLLADAGKKLPLTDEIIFTLEKEGMPRWHKFLQGYYDLSAITSDSFDQAIQLDEQGNPQLTPELQKKHIRLETSVGHTTFYTGFNMLDPVVGGYTERARKLRQAIALAIDSQEFIQIFYNGRGIPAQGPIPPDVFGYDAGEAGINPYVYTWENGKPKRKSIEIAKQLLAEAGYPDGFDKKTGKPLMLYYDASVASGPDSKSQFDWLRKQLAKINVQLQVRATQYNRFQQKINTGNVQLFFLGWVADYPDPENFLLLLYGPNSTVKYGGPNHVNYNNPEYDKLFDQMKALPNGPNRLAIIHQMLAILRKDSPMAWGFHPMNLTLSHGWRHPNKPDDIIRNGTKYLRIDPEHRAALQATWNKPLRWPLLLLALLITAIVLPALLHHRKKQRSKN